ncbi:MAG: N-acylneuraminate cytidylyltransferase [Candidatus Heimdallarchaeota archaeon LC_2]|nr:MAG: N-acylneuraminate cytidylyltransferase [Candidatus Heimdallarchaeota archaeon LC_2]
MKKNIVAIIPARGQSKRLPRKNILEFCGKPLIAHSIEAANKVEQLDKIIVSTEDEEIALISKNYDCEVINRSIFLAQDDSSLVDVLLQIFADLNQELDYVVDVFVLLQPTSPLRTADDISNALDLYLNNECDSVISVLESPHPPYWAMKQEDEYLTPLLGLENYRKRSQDLKQTYFPNGAIFIISPKLLEQEREFFTQRTLPHIMPSHRSIDIDSKSDFMLAEFYSKLDIKIQ